MNKRILLFVPMGLMISILGGCAFTTETVKIDYTPSSYSKVTETTTKTIQVNRLKDMRGVDPKLLSYKGTGAKTSSGYVSEREVSDIVTEDIKKLLSNMNYNVVDDKGTLAMTGEILRFETVVLMGFWSGQLEGNIQVNLRLIDNKSGNIIWTEIVSGSGKKTELLVDSGQFRKEALEKALDSFMANIYNSTSLQEAIAR